MAQERKARVPIKEIAQQISITHEIPLDVVTKVLNSYSAYATRMLAEGFLVQVLQDVRLEVQEYLQPRFNRISKRIVVNSERERPKARVAAALSIKEKEHERSSEKLREQLSN